MAASARTNMQGSPIVFVGALVVAFWVIELIDSVMLDDRLQGGGIHPRRVDGLDGVLWAPLLHGGWDHLISNTVPFVVLGMLVAAHGRRAWLFATAVIVLGGGALTWLLARSGNHVGASGVIFGYIGFLLGAALIRRNLRSLLLAGVAMLLYSGFWIGFVPRAGISWEGHLFGAIAGFGAARLWADVDPGGSSPRSGAPIPGV
jgi:membrane associated rhomboid family serine protease